jgi:hypothetical protein
MQLSHRSRPPQVPSPQKGHWPQSSGQLEQLSPPLHAPSPQEGRQSPQSSAQLEQLSSSPQVPSPQRSEEASAGVAASAAVKSARGPASGVSSDPDPVVAPPASGLEAEPGLTGPAAESSGTGVPGPTPSGLSLQADRTVNKHRAIGKRNDE